MSAAQDFLEHLMDEQPVKWQGLIDGVDFNIKMLKAISEWLELEWYERALYEKYFPEFAYMDDDLFIVDMRHIILSILN